MASDQQPSAEPSSPLRQALAWSVHLFTASGAVLALLALLAVERRQWAIAMLWLLVALVVDGLDGSLARWARVKERAARVDGDTLDLVIDYLTYVFVPTLLLWHGDMFPAGYEVWLASAILLSSLYLFARTDMKTEDGYFRGFPSLWNLVAFYLFVLRAGTTTVAVTIVICTLLTFAPVHFVHPFRVRHFGRWLPALATLWAFATGALLLPDLTGDIRAAALAMSLGSASILLALGLLRTFDVVGRRPSGLISLPPDIT